MFIGWKTKRDHEDMLRLLYSLLVANIIKDPLRIKLWIHINYYFIQMHIITAYANVYRLMNIISWYQPFLVLLYIGPEHINILFERAIIGSFLRTSGLTLWRRQGYWPVIPIEYDSAQRCSRESWWTACVAKIGWLTFLLVSTVASANRS